MNVGLVQAIRFLPGRPERLADTYRNFVDEAVLAEDLGLDFVWTTEHQEGVYWYCDFYTSGRSITGTKRYVPPSPYDLRAETLPPELVGTPDDILRRLEPQLKNSRVTHFGLLHRLAGMTTEVSRSSLELHVKEVMPVLETWGRQPVNDRAREGQA